MAVPIKTFEFRKRRLAKERVIVAVILVAISIGLFWLAAKDTGNPIWDGFPSGWGAYAARTICLLLGFVFLPCAVFVFSPLIRSKPEPATILLNSTSITTPNRLNRFALEIIQYEDISSLQFFKRPALPLTLLINFGKNQISIPDEYLPTDKIFQDFASELSTRCKLKIGDF